MEDLKEIKISKIFDSAEEVNNSEEYNNLFEGYVKRHIFKEGFKKGFVTEGKDIYVIYEMRGETEKGLCLLNKLNVHGILNNVPFKTGCYSSLRNVLVVNVEDCYSRSQEARNEFARIHRSLNIKPDEHIAFVTTSF